MKQKDLEQIRKEALDTIDLSYTEVSVYELFANLVWGGSLDKFLPADAQTALDDITDSIMSSLVDIQPRRLAELKNKSNAVIAVNVYGFIAELKMRDYTDEQIDLFLYALTQSEPVESG